MQNNENLGFSGIRSRHQSWVEPLECMMRGDGRWDAVRVELAKVGQRRLSLWQCEEIHGDRALNGRQKAEGPSESTHHSVRFETRRGMSQRCRGT